MTWLKAFKLRGRYIERYLGINMRRVNVVNDPKEQTPITYEDRHWVYFGYGVGWPRDKCAECYKLVNQLKKPNEHCINCWKLEIFFSNCADVDRVKEYLLEQAKKDRTLHGKWLKRRVEIPRSVLTSIPAEAHPDPEVRRDGAILIYTQSIRERDERKNEILADLKALGLYRKSAISYRRGCVNFDEIIGNWKTWYPLDKDYKEGGESDGEK